MGCVVKLSLQSPQTNIMVIGDENRRNSIEFNLKLNSYSSFIRFKYAIFYLFIFF